MTTDQTDATSSLSVDAAASAFNDIFSKEEKGASEATTPDTESTNDVDEEELVDEVDVENAQLEGEDEDAPEGEEEEAPEAEVPPPKLHKVTVDGEEIEVPEDELLKGYSRTADYTRKTQKLAQEVKDFQSERDTRSEERRQAAELYTRLEEAIASVTPAEPDWDTLRHENPDAFASEWAAWQQFKERTSKISADKQKAIALVQEDQSKALAAYLEAEQVALLEAIPSWKDATVAKTEKNEIAEFAKSSGYTDDDLAEVRDHRVVALLRKAMLYDKSQKAKPLAKVKIAAVKAATPGSSAVSSRTKTRSESLRQRLSKSGSVQDAAAYFSSLEK